MVGEDQHESPLEGDQINRLYHGEIFSLRAQRWSRERMHWLVGQATGESVLDVGCSQGIASLLLGRAGFRCLGVDVSAPQIAYARGELAREDPAVRERVRFEVADVRELEGGQYDTVVLGEVLEHDRDPDDLLARITGLLAPGGRVLITVPYGLQPAAGHLRSYYFGNLYDLVSRHLSVETLRTLNRNLVCICGREDGARFEFDRACLEMVETLYEELGLELYEVKDKLRIRAEGFHRLKDRLAVAGENLTRVREKLSARSQEVTELRDKLQSSSQRTLELHHELSGKTQELRESEKALAVERGRLIARIKRRLGIG